VARGMGIQPKGYGYSAKGIWVFSQRGMGIQPKGYGYSAKGVWVFSQRDMGIQPKGYGYSAKGVWVFSQRDMDIQPKGYGYSAVCRVHRRPLLASSRESRSRDSSLPSRLPPDDGRSEVSACESLFYTHLAEDCRVVMATPRCFFVDYNEVIPPDPTPSHQVPLHPTPSHSIPSDPTPSSLTPGLQL
jgi:hypothetical protein